MRNAPPLSIPLICLSVLFGLMSLCGCQSRPHEDATKPAANDAALPHMPSKKQSNND